MTETVTEPGKRSKKSPLSEVNFDDSAPLLDVENLKVEFHTRDGIARAVNNVSFTLCEGETLGIIGESGCGKSVTAQAIMGILDTPPARVAGGQVRYRGVDLIQLDEKTRRHIRANKIAIIFQDALSSLNPVFTVGWQLGELFRQHSGASRAQAKSKAVELLELVGIPARQIASTTSRTSSPAACASG